MILLIDDDPGLSEVIELLLVGEGYAVKRAGTVILTISIILWALMYFPRSGQPSAIGH